MADLLSYPFLCVLTDEAWEIEKSQLTLGRELGSGQFGVSSWLRSIVTDPC